PQIAALRDRYCILAYDTRGHGASAAPPGPYTLEMLADDLHGLLAALGISQPHFCGLSMGGMQAKLQRGSFRSSPCRASVRRAWSERRTGRARAAPCVRSSARGCAAWHRTPASAGTR